MGRRTSAKSVSIASKTTYRSLNCKEVGWRMVEAETIFACLDAIRNNFISRRVLLANARELKTSLHFLIATVCRLDNERKRRKKHCMVVM